MKINVVGTSGSGKSTLSRLLSHTLSLPYIELDRLFWLPNWGQTPDDEFNSKISSALQTASSQAGGWVLDGNYNRTKPVKWAEVDVVVWVDYGLLRTLYQAVLRAIARLWSGRELWPGTGNKEVWTETFFSKRSILWWTVSTYWSNKRRYEADMKDERYRHIRFVRLKSPSEVEGVVRDLKAMKG
jgi:adenylate kinase family enzyme